MERPAPDVAAAPLPLPAPDPSPAPALAPCTISVTAPIPDSSIPVSESDTPDPVSTTDSASVIDPDSTTVTVPAEISFPTPSTTVSGTLAALADSTLKAKTKKPKGQGRKHRHSKQKQKDGFSFRRGSGRKRSLSFPAAAKFFLPYKRPRKETIIPPTKFLLGGNISDPLNLNSLRDEDVNRAMNAVTPKSSPLPTPPRHKAKVEVIIPPNIRDPLNLLTPLDNDEYEKQLAIVKARRTRKRTRSSRRRHSDSNVPASSPPPAEPAPPPPPAEPPAQPHKRISIDTDPQPKDAKKLRRLDSLDKIVSPVIPQPGAWMRVHPRGGGHSSRGGGRGGKGRPSVPRTSFSIDDSAAVNVPHLPKFRDKDARYQFGNYDRYYGYRNLNAMMDVRLKVFELNRHLFNNKDVLDIGCNVGHISIAVARDFCAKSVTGIDIDKKLIARARKNVANFVIVPPEIKDKARTDVLQETVVASTSSLDRNVSIESADDNDMSIAIDAAIQEDAKDAIDVKKDEQQDNLKAPANKHPKKVKRNRRSHHKPAQDQTKQYFPISCPILYGPTEVAGCPIDGRSNKFPQNIVFKQANYVLKDENLINAEPPQYDLIMCLSVTKWFHLNWGDAGIKLAFKRMFAQLRPGGKLILEAQGWASYKKKKKLTETIYKNFAGIEFFPNKFKDYLLSPEVGFSKCCVLGVPQHLSKGFRRPIHLYIKGDFTPSKVQWSDTYAPSHHQSDLSIDERPKKVYAYVVIPSYHPSSSRWSGNNTPSYGAVTPCAFQLNENVATDESPFYNPRSDSYLPSYSSSSQTKTVYASLSSPQSDGGTPSHISEVGGSQPPLSGVYTNMTSPASPFLEPSPGNSTTPSHPFTPSHAASYDVNPANKKVYASLHSPHEDMGVNGRAHPIYSPSVAGTSRRGTPSGHSPLYTGSNLCPLPEVNDFDNANSNDSAQIKCASDHFTPAASPSSDVQTASDLEHNSPRDSNDTE